MLSQRSSERAGQTICKECLGKLVFDPDNGEQICGKCGIVSENFLGPSHLQYFGGRDISSSRTESTSAKYGLELPTVIGEKDFDAYGKHIEDGYEIARLRRINLFTISRDSRTRNLVKALGEVRRATDALGLGAGVSERAFQICRKAMQSGIRGKSVRKLALAAVCFASRELGAGFSVEQIDGQLTGINLRSVRYYQRFLERQLNVDSSPPSPATYVSRIANRASLSGRTERRALEMLDLVKDNPLFVGKRPVSLAASSLYLASVETGDYTTQLRVAAAAQVTTATVRKRSVELSRLLGLGRLIE